MGYSISDGGITCTKKGKSGNLCVCVGGGGREDNSKPFNVANAGMLSGKGWCHSYFLFLLQIFVGSPMYLIIEG